MAEAAERLGITKEAVRKRISRGTLRSEKDPDGTVHVYVSSSGTAVATFDRDELMAELRALIEVLRTDRDAWRDLARRSDYMASAALDLAREREARLRELEAPQESPSDAPESPETASDAGDTGPVHERFYGAFRRSMTLPAGTDESSISAYSDNGMLEITVKGGAVTESHRISIGDKPT